MVCSTRQKKQMICTYLEKVKLEAWFKGKDSAGKEQSYSTPVFWAAGEWK